MLTTEVLLLLLLRLHLVNELRQTHALGGDGRRLERELRVQLRERTGSLGLHAVSRQHARGRLQVGGQVGWKKILELCWFCRLAGERRVQRTGAGEGAGLLHAQSGVLEKALAVQVLQVGARAVERRLRRGEAGGVAAGEAGALRGHPLRGDEPEGGEGRSLCGPLQEPVLLLLLLKSALIGWLISAL